MHLDNDICYAAVSSRDPRFDGRFITGVLTTRVYCRPICPARTPKPANCRFFACAAAAAESGFRPCLRCRPEASPGTPAWHGTSATVSRALRLIAEGELDHGAVTDLASRLGVGDRHLRRLFNEHLGASPQAVAATRRLHMAKKLIDETHLTFSEIAFSAGYNSLRRFNEAVRESYGRSPGELRKRRGQNTPHVEGHLSLRLSYREPYSWETLVDFLAPRAIPSVEEVSHDAYRRSIAMDDQRGILEIRPGKSHLRLRVPVTFSRHLPLIVARVRNLFDLTAAPDEINRHLARDPKLRSRVRANPGLRVPGAWDRFELAVRAILGQQVSVSAATKLSGKLARAFGERVESRLDRIFPTPETLAAADVSSIGMPRARANAIRQLAQSVRDGHLPLDAATGLDEIVERLTRLSGIGPWTAQYIAMRGFKEPDALPSGDLGLRRALADGPKALAASRLLERAEVWRPWRSYAAMHLWSNSGG